MAAPKPPKCRPSRPLKSSTPKCSRAGASMKTLPRLDILSQQRHSLLLPRPCRLVYNSLEACVLLLDLFRWQQVSAGGQDRSFKDGVLRTVEAHELTGEATVNDPGIYSRAGWSCVDRYHLELSPGACGLNHRPIYYCGRNPGKLWARDSSLSEQHGVISEIDDGRSGVSEILECARLEEGLEDYDLLAPLHSHRREID